MRDAIGGVLSINLIIFVLFLVSGYLAYSVNYTKAFRVKNEIVNIIEEYEGLTGNAQDEIQKVTSQMGYKIPNRLTSSMESKGFCCFYEYGYCVSATPSAAATSSMSDDYQGWVYTVITYVNIDVPVLNKILPVLGQSLLKVTGETKSVYTLDKNGDNVSAHFATGGTCSPA